MQEIRINIEGVAEYDKSELIKYLEDNFWEYEEKWKEE